MSWTTPADLRAQVQRLWDRGDLLRATVDDSALTWPRRLSLKAPVASDLTERFNAVALWAADIVRMPVVRIEWREWAHRVQGRQQVPGGVWVDTVADALKITGKAAEAKHFQSLWRRTSDVQPGLLPWLRRRPLQALALADRWERLLAVVAWVQARPRPGVYLREVDAPGVDSKFLEAHRGTLTEWLDLILPSHAIDDSVSGVAWFNRRYGFRDKPVCIRFRILDPALSCLPGCVGLPDITLDSDSFATLALPLERVFITENEINFLAFPPMAKSAVVFGAGYGWEALARASWLHSCALHYWGDIDTHGFAILDQLRGHFPQVVSFLMDRRTLLAHELHWGEEPQPARHALNQLTPDESALYDELRFDRIRQGLRLEQERVGYGWVNEYLEAVEHRLLSGLPEGVQTGY